MTVNLSREILEHVKTYDEFSDLALLLSQADQGALFDFLFIQAISGPSGVAGALLVEIDPAPTRTCEQLLDDVAKSNWNVSAKEIPFYLISQFGKLSVKSSYQSYVKTANLTDLQKRRVGTIIYWMTAPTASLVRAHHDWPWTELEDHEANEN